MTTVLVTRPAGQSADLVEQLAARGIDAISVPTVEIEPAGAADLRSAMAAGADWLVITSANGAPAVVENGLPENTRVAAVGPATAAALRRRGIRVDHVPDEYLSMAVADGLGDVAGRRIVLACADAATPDLHDLLVARGAHVADVIVYRTVEAPETSRAPLHAALARPLDGVTFTSGSTARGYVALGGSAGLPAFCIGPVTAAEAVRAGLHVTVVAREHTSGGLAAVIADHFMKESS